MCIRDRVLYYARSADVEKDYMIKEIQLAKSVSRALVKNKQLPVSYTHLKVCLFSIDMYKPKYRCYLLVKSMSFVVAYEFAI